MLRQQKQESYQFLQDFEENLELHDSNGISVHSLVAPAALHKPNAEAGNDALVQPGSWLRDARAASTAFSGNSPLLNR
jgi:hypothetical protein